MDAMPNSTTDDSSEMFARVTWDWFSIVKLTLAIFGILGNALVIVVYIKKLRHSNSNQLIAILAIADLLTSVATIPKPSLLVVPNNTAGKAYCKIIESDVIMWISIVASIFTLTLLSVERYFAVVRPLKHRSAFNKARLRYYVVGVWISAITLNVASFYVTHVSDDNVCVLIWPSPTFQGFYGVTLFIVEFMIPVAVMVVSHFHAIRELKKQADALLARNESQSSPAFSLLRSRRLVIRMVLIVVITFIVCWAPDQIGFLVLNLGGLSPSYFRSLTYRCFTVLAFINSCANPIIYICLNKNFRAGVIKLNPFSARGKVGVSSEEGTATIRLPDGPPTG
ncbi:allatostatin-A receptor-like [Asterias amurensis]|uniref:allatostatin-A receptor-like n=1 Tax=Asterias amurensis TaxID=7602 RepID=UPI003AB7B0AD